MNEKEQLTALYQVEWQRLSEMKEDMDLLSTMSEEHLYALVEKSYKLKKVLDTDWKQICGNDVTRENMHPVLLYRNMIRRDFSRIHQIEYEKEDLIDEEKELHKQQKRHKESQKSMLFEGKKRAILMSSFAIMFLCSVIFQIVMLRLYHRLLMPMTLLLLIVPFVCCVYHGLKLKEIADKEENDPMQKKFEKDLQGMKQQMKEKDEEIELYTIKYDRLFEELDETQMDQYPYVEQILKKLSRRDDFTLAKNDYLGIMEILQFKHADMYTYVPEIFIEEESQNQFIGYIDSKISKLEEYLEQTKETA